VPLLSSEGQLIGWEGFGLDITEKHRSQAELLAERRRLKALYDVSSALQVVVDPAIGTLKGIQALKSATSSDFAIACFYDQEQDRVELVAAEGFSESSVHELAQKVNNPSLVRVALQRKQSFCVSDVESDGRNAAPLVTQRERIKSAILGPLIQDGIAIGAIVLFSRKRARYGAADLDLLNAALQQLSLAVQKAELLAAELRQANVASTLYQLSHELSRLMTPREMAAHAFPIIQGEIACRRMWLGMLNDQGSHIIGQAGTGPGVRRSIVDLQIPLVEQHEFIDAAFKSKEPVIVPAGVKMECATLNRLVTRLQIGVLVIVPLVSLGRVVGLMLLEPSVPSVAVAQRKLPLLKNMASEIATIMVARRFEGKMAESDKMRMAGVLASGVAHNFNNLLQAIMGQASLIEMQLPQGSPLQASTQLILESAGKGASLIKQLMSFSMQGGSVRRTVAVNSIISESQDLYRSLLGSRTELVLELAEGIPKVYADQSQMQQVITNLLMNARDAVANRKDGKVQISTSEVRVRPGELDPDMAPGIYLRIDVQDNGVGMDAERLSRCFEPFYTTKDVDSRTGLGLTGAGLGLSSSYSIVKQHEGVLSARSRPGEGSVFSVYLPALTVRTEEPPREVGRSDQRLERGPAIILVGIERAVREVCARSAVQLGGRVEAVEGSEQLSGKIVDDVAVIIVADPVGAQRARQLAVLSEALSRVKFSGTLVLLSSDPVIPGPIAEWGQRVRVVSPAISGDGLGAMIREVVSQGGAQSSG
jgi:signal transduction histidine kinase